jgi:YVTN family beta-propeller protein
MKRFAIALVVFALAAATAWTAMQRSRMKHPFSGLEITIPGKDGDGILLQDGWKITPAGRQLPSGDMILSAAVSPDGSLLAFTNSGYTRHQLHVVDLGTEKEIATFPLDRTWAGLAWSPNNKRILISAGQGNTAGEILTFQRWDDGNWTQARAVQLEGAPRPDKAGKNAGPKSAVSSLAISPDAKIVYAINDTDGNLYTVDGASGKTISKLNLGDHPFAGKLSRDGKSLYVSLMGEAAVVKVDVTNPAAPVIAGRMDVEDHPNDLAITPDDRMFVSCGNTNHVIAIDLKTGTKMEAVSVAPTPKAPAGSTPNSVALSPDGKQLFVANADNNSVAVIDISQRGQSRVAGFIPTGWYPTAVTVTPDGKRVLIGSGKGLGTGPNHVIRGEEGPRFVHHGNNLNGLISFVDMPSAEKLAEYTKQTYENSPYRDEMLVKADIKGSSVIPSEVGKGSPIKHILYIIKENRTYDQVFGDIAKGNGDPNLVMFGKEVSPNHHAIAEEFVLLDNLYCNGEVSQDGHPWSTAAYATDFNQRAWTLTYSNHGNVDSRKTEEQTHPYIWEAVMQKGLTAFSFGYSGRRGLAGIMSKTFGKNDLPDQQSGLRDYVRADQFVKEYVQMDAENRVPNFMVMGLGEDHTSGTRPGAATPQASVASNDIAIGKIVEAVSKSKAWASSAIFIIEDDAQNGPDHIDSHRTVGLVISPYIKRKTVDSTMYTTVSMLRTMELLLGLPPLTQHDAAATPMYNSFSNKADLSGYTAVPARIDIMSKNTVNSFGAAIAAKMDFSDYDRVDEQTLNQLLWHSIKGANVPMPAPVRRAFFSVGGVSAPVGDDDDDDHPKK